MIRRDNQAAKQRSVERRLREDEAPRLTKEIKRLKSLQIDVDNGGNKYVWRIVVERAPALFVIACPEPACQNGGHDITRAVLQSLRSAATRFDGESACRGEVASGDCGRVLKYVAQATYGD
jgi:hypothetical protein